MRKFNVLWLALGAVFAMFAVTASAASAETITIDELPAEFLAAGGTISGELAFDVSGELLLEDMKATGGAVGLLCSDLMVGTILSATDAEVAEVLNLAGTSADILCKLKEPGDPEGLCKEPVLVEALNLPWLITPDLWEFLDEHGNLIVAIYVLLLSAGAGLLPAYLSECETFLGRVSDSCEGETGAIALDEATGLEAEFSEALEEVTVPGSCSMGGAKQDLFQGIGLITDTADGSLLSISSV